MKSTQAGNELDHLSSAEDICRRAFANFDPSRVSSPAFVIDYRGIEANLKILRAVADAADIKILAALKAYSSFATADLFRRYLDGACASGPYEAQLAAEHFVQSNGEVHTYSAGFKEQGFSAVAAYSQHIVFNSLTQYERFSNHKAIQPDKHSFGLRFNPEHSEGAVALYDPCRPCSRMGMPISQLKQLDPNTIVGNAPKISGLHFHSLCEQGFSALDNTLAAIEKAIPEWLHAVDWLNLGGGHHITVKGYEREALVARLRKLKQTYNLKLYMEPGEACAINAGVLICEVQDIMQNGKNIAIVDTSATCHMPDVLEMPYTPEIFGARPSGGKPHGDKHEYVLGGPSCLTGDEIGSYHFDSSLKVGDRLILMDMAIYSIVKTNTFNGIPLPDIVVWDSRTDEILHTRCFGYEDFKSRLS